MSTIPFIKIILLLAFTVGCCCTGLVKEEQSLPLKRVKRNLWQFKNMIECATGRSALDYNGYGCWCGLGGSGTPVDSTDRCCEIHDKCYDRAIDKGCDPYTDWYNRSGCTGCASSNGYCAKFICECDGAAARCFANSTFNPNYENYPQDRCWVRQWNWLQWQSAGMKCWLSEERYQHNYHNHYY